MSSTGRNHVAVPDGCGDGRQHRHTRLPAAPHRHVPVRHRPTMPVEACQSRRGGAIDWSRAKRQEHPCHNRRLVGAGGSCAVDRVVLGSGNRRWRSETVSGTFSRQTATPSRCGGGTQTNGANAQFVTRRLEVVAAAHSRCGPTRGRDHDPGRAGRRSGALSSLRKVVGISRSMRFRFASIDTHEATHSGACA
jgi:hypothetical protein